jgi:2-polyprenyl-3-methyl-5-hydroxy-6-metoxy-1,4-benzoquinol methylase
MGDPAVVIPDPTMFRTRRILHPERMDDPEIDPRVLRSALRHLALSNRVTGATGFVRRQFSRWLAIMPARDNVRILDVGTGSADIPIALADWAGPRDIRLQIVAVDLHVKTLEYARERVGGRANIELVHMNALDLMDRFPPESFHFVHAGLFLHHLQEIEVLTVLRIMDRLASCGMIWNDLRRSWPMKVLFRSMAWTGPPVFRHDAVASIDAAFTRAEALDLVARAGWTRPKCRGWLGHRFLITSTKQHRA